MNRCPHCKAEIRNPKWTVCPECGGALESGTDRSATLPQPADRLAGEEKQPSPSPVVPEKQPRRGPGAPMSRGQGIGILIAVLLTLGGAAVNIYSQFHEAKERKKKRAEAARLEQEKHAEAQRLYEKSKALMQQKKFARALPILNRLIQVSPRYEWGWYMRGQARRLTGDLKGSLSDFDRVVTLNPKNWQAWGERAITCNRLGREKEFARSVARAKALPDAPKNFEALLQKRLQMESAGTKE